MEKLIMFVIIYIGAIIFKFLFNYIQYKKKEKRIINKNENIERNIKINHINFIDKLEEDFIYISAASAITFLVAWFIF